MWSVKAVPWSWVWAHVRATSATAAPTFFNLPSRQRAVCFHIFHPHSPVIHHADTGGWTTGGWISSGANGLVLLDVHYSKMHSLLFLQLTQESRPAGLKWYFKLSCPTDSFSANSEKRLKIASVLSGHLNSLQSVLHFHWQILKFCKSEEAENTPGTL